MTSAPPGAGEREAFRTASIAPGPGRRAPSPARPARSRTEPSEKKPESDHDLPLPPHPARRRRVGDRALDGVADPDEVPGGDPPPMPPADSRGCPGEPWPVAGDAAAGGCGDPEAGALPTAAGSGRAAGAVPSGGPAMGCEGEGRSVSSGRPSRRFSPVPPRRRRRIRARADSRGRQRVRSITRGGAFGGLRVRRPSSPDKEVQEEGCPCPFQAAPPVQPRGAGRSPPASSRSLLSRFLPDSLILFRGGGRAGAPRRGGRAPR